MENAGLFDIILEKRATGGKHGKNCADYRASRGIGRQIARDFAAHGYGVVINYFKNRQAALQLQEELGSSALAVQADISDPEAVANMVQQAQAHFGDVDVLINNAGISSFGLLTEMTREQWMHVFDINVHGAYYCIREVLPAMIHNQRGVILNISSMWGVVGASCEVCYSATKAALIGLTKALAKEVGPAGIRVNCIAPGRDQYGYECYAFSGCIGNLKGRNTAWAHRPARGCFPCGSIFGI